VQSSYIIYAPLIQLNFQSSDIPAKSTNAATGSPTGTVSSSPGSSPTSGDSAATALPGGEGQSLGSGEDDAGTLTQAQKAGIGIGVAAVVVILGFFLFWFFRRIRKRKMVAMGKLPDSENNGAVPLPPKTSHEADGQEVKELEAVSKPQEIVAPVPTELTTSSAAGQRASMQNPGQVYELEADSPVVTQRSSMG
jgi:hypothetical protein